MRYYNYILSSGLSWLLSSVSLSAESISLPEDKLGLRYLLTGGAGGLEVDRDLDLELDLLYDLDLEEDLSRIFL